MLSPSGLRRCACADARHADARYGALEAGAGEPAGASHAATLSGLASIHFRAAAIWSMPSLEMYAAMVLWSRLLSVKFLTRS